MSKHRICATRSGCVNGMDFDAEYEITFSYTPGAAPIIHPADNADPGYPAEVDFVSVKPLVGIVDAGAFTDLAQKDLDDWAREWLADEGHQAALLAAEDDDEAARERAAEMRADR